MFNFKRLYSFLSHYTRWLFFADVHWIFLGFLLMSNFWNIYIRYVQYTSQVYSFSSALHPKISSFFYNHAHTLFNRAVLCKFVHTLFPHTIFSLSLSIFIFHSNTRIFSFSLARSLFLCLILASIHGQKPKRTKARMEENKKRITRMTKMFM